MLKFYFRFKINFICESPIIYSTHIYIICNILYTRKLSLVISRTQSQIVHRGDLSPVRFVLNFRYDNRKKAGHLCFNTAIHHHPMCPSFIIFDIGDVGLISKSFSATLITARRIPFIMIIVQNAKRSSTNIHVRRHNYRSNHHSLRLDVFSHENGVPSFHPPPQEGPIE